MEHSDIITFLIIYLLDYFFSIIFSFIFIQYYAKKNISKIILCLSYFLLFANFFFFFTLPYEIIWNRILKKYEKQDTTVASIETILKSNYRIIYFFLIILGQYIAPSFRFYFESGEFTLCGKILDTLKKTILLYMIFILIIALAFISKDFQFAVLSVFIGLNIIYSFIFLAHSIIDIPKKMNIHSDINLSLEYYEYKADKKLNELNKFHDKIKTNYHRCQKTLKYIENIEYFLENNDIKIDDKDKLDENDKKGKEKNEDILIENKEYSNDIINDNKKSEQKEQNLDKEEKLLIKESIENEEDKKENKDKENKENDKDKIIKDYKKHKDIIKCKKYINIVLEYIQKLIPKYNVEIGNEGDEEPFKKMNEISEANFKMKLADREIERISAQILEIYKGWCFKKGISLELQKDINNLIDKDFIPPPNISLRKIQFYKKYNKIIYKSLMILFILFDILILFQEISLALPVNISLFSLIFKQIDQQIPIHITFIIIGGLFYLYASYSFSKIKSFGVKYMIFGGKLTNTLGLFTFCMRLSNVSFPISMNIIIMIFHQNIKDEEKGNSIVEQYFSGQLGGSIMYLITSFIPLILIIILILDYFNVCGILCKKKKKKQNFYLKNEIRENKIANGKAYLMKLNKDYLGSIKLLNK